LIRYDRLMKGLFTVLFPFFISTSFGQRVHKTQQVASILPPETVKGQLIQVQIINADSVPLYIRSGPFHFLNGGDTVELAKIYDCTDDSKKPYYDLDYLTSEENNCVRWYTLQMVNPGDTVGVTCRLTGFNWNDSTRLYIGYITKLRSDDSRLFSDPNAIYIMKEPRAFEWIYLQIQKSESAMRLAKSLCVLASPVK